MPVRATTAIRRRPVGGGGGGGGLSFLGLTTLPRPTFTPTRTVTFTTKAGLDAAISGMAAGDLIQYTGTGVLTITSSTTNGYSIAKQPSATVVIDFGCSHNIWDPATITGNYVAFRYTGTSSFAAIYLHDNSRIRFFGGDYSAGSTGGSGVTIYGNTDSCYFWDLYSHDSAFSAFGALSVLGSGATAPVTNNFFRLEGTTWALDHAGDTHADKGSGEHGFICADAGGAWSNNVTMLYVHDGNGGAGLEIGSQVAKGTGAIANNEFYILANHLTFVSTTQTGGNAIQWWGDKDYSTHVVHWVEGNDLQGACTHGSGIQTPAGISVEHGRHTSTNQNPHETATVPGPYDLRWGIAYSADCNGSGGGISPHFTPVISGTSSLSVSLTRVGGGGGAYIKEVGHFISGNAPGTTIAIPVTNAPGAGNLLIVSVAETNVGTSSVSDSKGNTYTKDKSQTNGAVVSVFSTVQDVATLTTSDTITVTFSGSVSGRAVAACHEFSGSLTPKTVDKTATGSSSTTSTTARDAGTTAATVHAHDIIWAAHQIPGAETSFTPAAGYTSPTTAFYANSTVVSIMFEYKIVTSTAAYNPTGTGGATDVTCGVTVAYEAT